MAPHAAAVGAERPIQAARHFEGTFEHRDGALDAGPEALQTSEDRVVLALDLVGGARPFFGDGDVRDVLLESLATCPCSCRTPCRP